MKQLFLGLAFASITLTSPVGVPREQPRARATMEGTWRSDTNNFWTRADGQRWISLQLERDGNQTGFGVPEEQAPALGDGRANGPVHFTLHS